MQSGKMNNTALMVFGRHITFPWNVLEVVVFENYENYILGLQKHPRQ
jgi:hypothetical protein